MLFHHFFPQYHLLQGGHVSPWCQITTHIHSSNLVGKLYSKSIYILRLASNLFTWIWIHLNLFTCGVSHVQKFIWSGSLVARPKERNYVFSLHFGGAPCTEIHIKWKGSLFLAAWTTFPLESNTSRINGIEFGSRTGFSPWTSFLPFLGEGRFSD